MKACLLKLIRNSQHTYPLEFGLHPQKPDPVSYTHLDVYKRQKYEWA